MTETRIPQPAPRSTATWATVIILIGSAVLLFTHLGHYALWDDEAITAMTARGVWRTGDTSAKVDDHNILAYRNGLLINHFKDRYTPPLQFYVLAPFIGVLGESSFVCRFPFAICGFLTVCIMLRWLWKTQPSRLIWWAAVILILTNFELFLFARNCRYYSLATLFTAATGYFYYYFDGKRKTIILLSIAMSLLLAAQYLNYAAAVVCLVVDYAIWGRKRRPLTVGNWMLLLIPQIIVGAVVCSIWNPVARLDDAATEVVNKIVLARLKLFAWNWEHIIASDFLVVSLFAFAPLIYFFKKDSVLLRVPLVLVVYITVVALLATAPTPKSGAPEIRYLAPAIPVCIAIGLVAVYGMQFWSPKLRNAALGITAVSMLIQPAPQSQSPMIGSDALRFYNELFVPQQEPYTPTEAWINANVAPGKSILVHPEWMKYPLMFAAGKAVYAWQLTDPPKPDYVNMPDIHFAYRKAPDYMIGFGPWNKEVHEAQARLTAKYEVIQVIPFYWKDMYRPEKTWRSFATVNPKPEEMIYIYKRMD